MEAVVFLASLDYNYVEIFVVLRDSVYDSLLKLPSPLLLEYGNRTLRQIINKVGIKPTMPQHPRDCPFSNSNNNNNNNNNNIFIFEIIQYSYLKWRLKAMRNEKKSILHAV